MSKLPDLSGIESLLAPYRGSVMHVIEYQYHSRKARGNNGDRLIDFAFRSLLERLEIATSINAKEAAFYGVRPGGALLESYSAPWILKDRLRDLPSKPIVIFPSSSWFPTRNPVDIFGSLSSPVLWILRERRSYNHLKSTWGAALQNAGIQLELDHDVVLSSHVSVRDLLHRYSRTSDAKGPLLVSRLGVEASNMLAADQEHAPSGTPSLDLRARRLGLAALQRLPRKGQLALRRRQTRARQAVANDRLHNILSAAGMSFPRDVIADYDISDPELADFDEFCALASRATIVATNRLHVAIPSIILGTPTYLVDSGYHKLSGVFEHSLAGVPGANFVSDQISR